VKIEWALQAEGLGQDARGAFTIIGVNQNVLTVSSLPARTKRAIVLHIIEVEAGESLSLSVSMKDPDGVVVLAQSADMTPGEFLYTDIPTAFDVPAEMVISVEKWGTYTFEAVVQGRNGGTSAATLSLYVRQVSRS
jgi:hypothetical protein